MKKKFIAIVMSDINLSKSIILELYDKDPKNWLFGQEFN